MRVFIRPVLLFALLALWVAPAAAQTRVDALPEPVPFQKARLEVVLTIFGEPVAYGRGVIDGPERAHLAVQTPGLPDVPGETLEAILYDGVYYTRRDDDPQWYISDERNTLLPDDVLPIDITRTDVPITLIGATEVGGVPTDHYQRWFAFDDGTVVTLDTFIGQADGRIHKIQINAYATPEDAQPLISFAYRYYDFEATDIVVYPPEGAIPLPGASAGGLIGQIAFGIRQLDALTLHEMR